MHTIADDKKLSDSSPDTIDLSHDEQSDTELKSAAQKQKKSRKRKKNFGCTSKTRPPKQMKKSDSFIQSPFITTVNDIKFCLVKTVNEKPKVINKKNKIPFFDLTKEKDIDAFEKVQRKYVKDYEYDRIFNKDSNIKLFIAPVFVLDENYEQFGVFANQNLRKGDKIIAYYAGEHALTDEDENENSKAVFQIINKKGEVVETIDGERKGDWTAKINGGQNPNLFVNQEIIDGEAQICFRVGANIKKGQQCILDYGDGYKNKLGKLYCNLHPDDNWQSPNEIYSAKKNTRYYAPGLYRFDEQLCKAWLLNPNHNWVIPRLFLCVFENDLQTLSQLLEEGCPPDLLGYACEGAMFVNSSEQQHLTALMLACYLNRQECIEFLLDAGADPDRCMLINGLSPLALLLKSPATNAEIQASASVLLQHMRFPFISDKYDLSLLHYCITRNCTKLAEELLQIAHEENHDFYIKMFAKNGSSDISHTDVDYCIIHEQFEMLKILVLDMVRRKVLIKHFNLMQIFKESTLLALRPEQQQKFYAFLNNEPELQSKKILLLDAIKKYLLILMGKKLFISENISPEQEIELLWRFIKHSKNLEKISLFLYNINPVLLFQKCIALRSGISYKVSPLEFALSERPDITTLILGAMQDYLERVDLHTSFDLLKNYDLYSCINLAIEQNNQDAYDSLLGFLQKYDTNKSIITLLLSQYIENFRPMELCRTTLEKLCNDLTNAFKIDLNPEQKRELLFSFINFYKANEEHLEVLHTDCIFILELINSSFPMKKQLGINHPLIAGLKNQLPVQLLSNFLKEGDINGSDEDTCPLTIAIKNESTEQVSFLLVNGAKVNEHILKYAHDINSRIETIQLLQNTSQPPQSGKYFSLWTTPQGIDIKSTSRAWSRTPKTKYDEVDNSCNKNNLGTGYGFWSE